jgi:maltooligosyltrehalose trehalohydrolase
VLFPGDFSWSEISWRGISLDDLVIYELHVGLFTPEGTFEAIVPRLPQLAELGVTALEIMPVAQFSGQRNWGYDGVHPFAAQNSYGGPHGLQRLVDAAHRAGLAVILDVVYNHFGPEGCYLQKFGPYFTDHYHTPWGNAVNFDTAWSDAVRQFVVDNACSWVRDFRVDGLRLDAVQAMLDHRPTHILAEIQQGVQRVASAQQRIVHVIGETSQNDVRMLHPPSLGGYGLDAVWCDDLHHSVHTLLTGECDGYYMDYGRAAHVAKAFHDPFVYDGRYSRFRRRRHGSDARDCSRARMVVCMQNHDQVGNRASGNRLNTMLSDAAQRLVCGLLMLSPCTPLLFMGEEYGEERPFPFFCSFSDPQLIEAVRRGRHAEFATLLFKWQGEVPDPQDPLTFAAGKLTWQWPDGSPQARRRQLYKDLLTARRQWPALRDRRHTTARLWPDLGPNAADPYANWAGEEPVVLMIERGQEQPLWALANLSGQPQPIPPLDMAGRKLLLSTEDICYGGQRSTGRAVEELSAFELCIFGYEQCFAS